MSLKIYEDSKNYTCQVIKLPTKIPVKGLDNLVEVNVQGNSCLVSKDSPDDELYLFFPAECQISNDFLNKNNLYRHETLNQDPTKKGFFEDNRRVKALKFKGIISSGFVIPVKSLTGVAYFELKVGDEFNELWGVEICKKYIRPCNTPGKPGSGKEKGSRIKDLVDTKMAPEHMDTAHLMKNLHKLDLETRIIVSYKLHGTSARTFNTLIKRKLNWKEKLAKRLGVKVLEEQYESVVCSRRQVKSIGFEELANKNHYYASGDLWSEVAKVNFNGELNKGEAVYYEIVGKTFSGEAIQGGYSYGFDQPIVYIYRISNINPQGIEIDLPYDQMVERACQMGLIPCPEFFSGTVVEFLNDYPKYIIVDQSGLIDIGKSLENIFYNKLLEQPSILDKSVVEEGFCIRVDKYPRPEIFKIKSKKFLEHETKALDKEVVDMEEEQTQDNGS